MALAHCQASKVYEKQQKNGVFEQSVDTNLLHIIEAKHVSTHIERHFVHPTYLDKRHFGSFDISPPLSVDLLPLAAAKSLADVDTRRSLILQLRVKKKQWFTNP